MSSLSYSYQWSSLIILKVLYTPACSATPFVMNIETHNNILEYDWIIHIGFTDCFISLVELKRTTYFINDKCSNSWQSIHRTHTLIVRSYLILRWKIGNTSTILPWESFLGHGSFFCLRLRYKFCLLWWHRLLHKLQVGITFGHGTLEHSSIRHCSLSWIQTF